MQSHKSKFTALLRRFRRDRKGTTAIEFSFLILPFLLLLFSIIEVCVSFMGQQLLSNAVDRAARQLRTGELRAADVQGTKLRDLICDQIEILIPSGCPGLSVNLQSYQTFVSVPKSGIVNAAGQLSLGNRVDPGEALSINQLNALYRWPLLTDIMRRQLSAANSDGTWPLFATNTWQNEPFPLDR
ncbi:TadE/TadG family type IV pilus assembly protein [Brucella endophytica]|nr:TadE/TadG family type IV pilus assembly protein [Brucella endophytica]